MGEAASVTSTTKKKKRAKQPQNKEPAPAALPASWRAGGKIWLGEQETSYSCGPASLKYALCVLGFSPKEQQLRALAHTTWEGTQTTKLLAAARRFGLTPQLHVFFDLSDGKRGGGGYDVAWQWLLGELKAGRIVILDVEGYAHYVVAVQELEGSVVIIDPEGETMNGTDYADVVIATKRSLRSWWLAGEEEGEPEAFRGISLQPGTRAGRPRLRFSAAALRRYRQGRPWILDEYLIDVGDIASGVQGLPGDPRPLADVLRELDDVATRAVFWHESTSAEVQMARAHLEDLAVAADAMGFDVPGSDLARQRIAVDVTALLTAMLWSPD